MSSSASRAPAPITPILWLASARQSSGSARGQPGGRAQPRALALTHVAGTGQGVTGAVVAAADAGTVGSVAPGRAGQVTAGGKGCVRVLHPPPHLAAHLLPDPLCSRECFSSTAPLHPGGALNPQGWGAHHPRSGFAPRSGDSAQLDLKLSYCCLRGTSPLDTVIRKGH